jgi:hypothetical protein
MGRTLAFHSSRTLSFTCCYLFQLALRPAFAVFPDDIVEAEASSETASGFPDEGLALILFKFLSKSGSRSRAKKAMLIERFAS